MLVNKHNIALGFIKNLYKKIFYLKKLFFLKLKQTHPYNTIKFILKEKDKTN
jgi:hypothetical protein